MLHSSPQPSVNLNAVTLAQWDTTSPTFELDFRKRISETPLPHDKIYAELAIDNAFDALLGFPSIVHSRMGRSAYMHGYVATPLARIIAALKESPLESTDVFCDIGAGLCRVPLFVRCWTGCTSVGIDYDPSLISFAQKAIERHGLTRTSAIVSDARTMDYSFANVFFMYQPFDGPVLEKVLSKLEDLSKTKPITVWWLGNHHNWPEKTKWLRWDANHLRHPWDNVSVARSR